MASTLLEQTRAALEDREHLERLVVKDFKNDAKGHKERLNQGHRVSAALDNLQAQSNRLIKVFQDEDGLRKEEIDSLRGSDPYRSFYERLKEVRDYHRRHPDEEITQTEDDDELLKAEPKVDFSGEEGGGRFLDLHEHFHTLQNSKFKKEIPYSEYCVAFDHFEETPREHRLSKYYRDYVAGLLRYLEDFYKRTQPLQILSKVYKDLQNFDEEFEGGQCPGWEDRGEGKQVSEAEGAIDLEAFASVEELLAIGSDKLKEALAALGLKTGGTLQERAERLWLTKSTPLSQIPRKHFAKTSAIGKSETELQKLRVLAKDIALHEHKISALRLALKQVPQETKDNVEKKQARTYEEIQAEQAEAELAEVASDSDEEDGFIYNPHKFPLGYDGKPIPHWLFKLHGLNQEFNCEICGNYTYKGRREFERHFREWRHQNNMRAMGIPNNKNFFEITKIKDAQELWQNIQDRQKGGFKKEVEEEFEDNEGNVYNRKTYEDLKKQGLI